MPRITDSKYLVMAGWDDVPHLTEQAKIDLLAATPPYLRDARSKGIPALGSGAIYPVPETDIVIDDFAIPAHYRRGFGFDVGWHKTAAIWGAHDQEADVLYLYSEYYRGQAEPSSHAQAVQARGKWMRGAIDPASRGRSQLDGKKLFESYQSLGVNLQNAKNAREAGLFEVLTRLTTGRLKIFRSLQNTLSEYRIYRRDEKGAIVKSNDHLMDALRYLVMTMGVMRTKPAVKSRGVRNVAPQNWMSG
ncbi:MAG: hypothetical protein L3J21_09870 [Devosiaceae bacterium]|nr:hypothetical protein [Devosiaceae bacterium]